VKKGSGLHKSCRIAVSSMGRNLDDKVGPLARSPYFFLFEGSPENFTLVENLSHTPGVEGGVMAAKALLEKKVDTVITGTIGRRAHTTLKEAGISVKAGCIGSVSQAVRKCASGELEECKGATFAGHTV
jgi:predicted Fe-Mo cluster-binding NifX family protein